MNTPCSGSTDARPCRSSKSGPDRPEAAQLGVQHVEARALAILLREPGWDVVPLLLKRPTVAIHAHDGQLVAMVDAEGTLHLRPGSEAQGERVRGDVEAAEARLSALRTPVTRGYPSPTNA